jgi:hypothetical protein
MPLTSWHQENTSEAYDNAQAVGRSRGATGTASDSAGMSR